MNIFISLNLGRSVQFSVGHEATQFCTIVAFESQSVAITSNQETVKVNIVKCILLLTKVIIFINIWDNYFLYFQYEAKYKKLRLLRNTFCLLNY